MEEIKITLAESWIYVASVILMIGGYVAGFLIGKIRLETKALKHSLDHMDDRQARIEVLIKHYQELVEDIEKKREAYEIRSKEYEDFQQGLTYCYRTIGQLENDVREMLTDFNPKARYPLPRDESYEFFADFIKNKQKYVNISREQWDDIFKITDLRFTNLLLDLKVRFGITRHEQEICCLLKWGFSREDMLVVFNNTPEALAKSTGRLRNRLRLDKKACLEEYIGTYLSVKYVDR